MRSQSVPTLLLMSCLVGGCVRTIQPILEDNQVIVDNSLAGKWSAKSDKSFFEVQPADDQKLFKVTYTDKEGKKAPLIARLGKIGEITVAELRADDPAPDSSDVYKAHLLPLYSFLVIRETKPELKFAIMRQDWLKKFLDDHPKDLQTTALDKDNLIVTSSTADFQRFLLRHYQDEGVLKGEGAYIRKTGSATDTNTTQPSK